ncbi:hypothetical protein D3C75_1125410 [compost metagenome]
MGQGRQRHGHQQQGGDEHRRHQVEDDAGRLGGDLLAAQQFPDIAVILQQAGPLARVHLGTQHPVEAGGERSQRQHGDGLGEGQGKHAPAWHFESGHH